MTLRTWQRDCLRDILWEAWRPDRAQPAAIRVRPEVHTRILAAMTTDGRIDVADRGVIGHPHGLPLTIDRRLPSFPGYEIDRQPPERTP